MLIYPTLKLSPLQGMAGMGGGVVSRSTMGAGGGGLAGYTSLSLNGMITTTGSWQLFSPASNGILLIQGGGGGGGNRSTYGAVGGEGGYVKIPVSASTFFRVWIGLGGGAGTNGSTQTTDGSGYGAHGGAGGTGSSSTTGGSGGTPTIIESTTDGVNFTLVAMAGAGGGGGQHSNTSTLRGGGGGTWSAHPGTGSQLNNVSQGSWQIHYGTVAGTYGGSANNLAGNGGTNYYQGATGNDGNGVDANVQNRYFGGYGGNSTSNNPGGGGGGGYGGGSGGSGGGNAAAAQAGGYIQVGSTRWGGTSAGGWHNGNAGSGGGGGGSYYDSQNYSGAGEKVGEAMGLTPDSSNMSDSRSYRQSAHLGTDYGYGGAINQSGGQGALKFVSSSPF